MSGPHGTEADSRTSSYPTPPLLADCREAFRLLPSGTVPTLWYTKPVAGEQRNVLPLEVHHGQQPPLSSRKETKAAPMLRDLVRHVSNHIPRVWPVRRRCRPLLDRAKRHQSHGLMGTGALLLLPQRRNGHERLEEHHRRNHRRPQRQDIPGSPTP